MKSGHVEIFVKDPLKAVEFYEKVLGFEVYEVQHRKFVWMKLNDNIFMLRPGKNDLEISESKDSNAGFVLYTDDLEKTKQELTNRGLEFKGNDGSQNGHTFTDPDGNWFQLVDSNHS